MHLLVVGTPRSGTTLLTCLIGAHPQCIAMSECFWGEETKIVSPSDVVVNKLCAPNQIQFEHPPLPNLLRRAAIYARDAFVQRTGLWIRDWPLGVLSIREYVRERDAHLLFILRDPDHVIDSMVRRDGLSESGARSRWTHGIREMHRSYTEYDHRCHTLSFSDLVNDPERTLREVCEFLTLEYRSDMLTGYEHSPQYSRDNIDASVLDKDVKNYRVQERQADSYEKYSSMRDS